MKLLPPPGPERRRQLTWLGLLAIVVAALAWYQFGRAPEPAAARPAASNPKAGGTNTPGQGVLPEPVKLGDLASEGDAPSAGRNLFRFGVKPTPAPPPVVLPPPQQGPPPSPSPPPGPPAIRLRCLGTMERPDVGRVVALKDPDSGAVFQALEGQIVDGRYRVVKIGLTSVIVSYIDGSGQRTLSTGG
jgi:hypothetical protein